MGHILREASMHAQLGQSPVVPLIIEGLPAEITGLGRTWRRKREFHLTVAAADGLAAAGAFGAAWSRVQAVLSGRALGPVVALDEIRRAAHPDEAGLETLIVMAAAPGLGPLYAELSDALDRELTPPPAHVTLYSTDPDRGIGISDDRELATRAPRLPDAAHAEIRAAMRFDRVFGAAGGFGRADGSADVFTPRVLDAFAYAAHVHRDDVRKGTSVPYVSHLLAVAALVAEDGGGEAEIIGALLHDTAEDHGGEPRLADVRARFGPEVAGLVRDLSDSLRGEGEEKEEWRPRKERYLRHLRDTDDEAALRISNADKLHNARAILADFRREGDALWARFNAGEAEQLWYYGELAQIFFDRRPGSPLADELAAAVAQLRLQTTRN